MDGQTVSARKVPELRAVGFVRGETPVGITRTLKQPSLGCGQPRRANFLHPYDDFCF